MNYHQPFVEFTTANGNQYIYNDRFGIVTPSNQTETHDNLATLADVDFNTSIELEANGHEVERYLKLYGYNQLIFIVTEQCNLRCKYCAYSGNYYNNRTHKNMYMEWETAQKALFHYYQGFMQTKKKKPGLLPTISFYGGEPALSFELIRQIFKECQKLFGKKAHFNLTTNGTALSHEMIRFFIDNDFHLGFSLNGNITEHDRLRIYPDGTGSYNHVWHTMQTIRRINPKYFNDNCMVNTVFDYGTDMCKLYSFFRTRTTVLPKLLMASEVSKHFTDWYSQYSESDFTSYLDSIALLRDEYFNRLYNKQEIPTFLQSLFGNLFKRIIIRTQNSTPSSSLLPLTATCYPGYKLAVSTDGFYHMCERINDHFPIGSTTTGIDTVLIAQMITQYREQIYSECYHCPVKRLCQACMAVFAGNNTFSRNPADYCEKTLQFARENLSLLWTLFENGVPESAFYNNH